MMDIITQILYRLPSKSVGRFRCVSKGWLSLLTDPQFIKTHQRTLKDPNHLIFKDGYQLLYSHPFHHHDEPILKPTKLPIEFDDSISFHGSCDGLVLVSHRDTGRFDTLVLLNPTTRESVQLPQPAGYYDHQRNQESLSIGSTHGVGYDSVTDDYKVITLTYFDYYTNNDRYRPPRTTIRVSLYSLRSNTWRQLMMIDSPYDCRYSPPAVYVNGFLHWYGMKKDDRSRVIVAFSLADECFSEVPSPSSCNDTEIMSKYCCIPVVLGGKLAIYVNSVSKWSRVDFEVWLMNEYGVKESWTKIPLDIFNEFHMVISKIFDDNGKIRVASKGTMLIYDFEKRTFSKNVYVWNRRFWLFGSYVESLVSPKRKDTTDAKQILDSSTERQNVGSKDSEAENLDPIFHPFCNKSLRFAKILKDKKASLRKKEREEGKAKPKNKRKKVKKSILVVEEDDDVSLGDSEESGKDFENLKMLLGNVTFQDFLHAMKITSWQI